MSDSYRAVALQTTCRTVTACEDAAEARALIRENIEKIARQVPATIAWTGRDTRLFVLPEYLLTRIAHAVRNTVSSVSLLSPANLRIASLWDCEIPMDFSSCVEVKADSGSLPLAFR